jgi:uncharacterized protein DUF2393
MGNAGQPDMGPSIGPPTVAEERDSSRVIIVVAVVAVILVMLGLAFLMREKPQAPKPVSPYLASVKLSDFKMSAAENFIGATVSYIDGTVTNSGDKTVTHVAVEVEFKDDTGQLAQREDVALQVIRNNGAYTEPVDLSVAPLGPGQSQTFRLTFERISVQWNHAYPDIRVTDVAVK